MGLNIFNLLNPNRREKDNKYEIYMWKNKVLAFQSHPEVNSAKIK